MTFVENGGRPTGQDGQGGEATLSALARGVKTDRRRDEVDAARELLGALVQPAQYVGEVFELSYESALAQIHDEHRMKAGGIPSLAFLVATRLRAGESIDYAAEDSSVILLRVMDAAPLPNHAEAQRVRVEAAQRVAGVDRPHWDDESTMDTWTAMVFGFAGVRCRVIGTFYLTPQGDPDAPLPLKLAFGRDISNFYPNRGLKVYKPNGAALERIVNFREAPDSRRAYVPVGAVRYASTARPNQGIGNVPVEIDPRDLLGQKTALFGMTRTGKSNTTKVILKSVFDLRYDRRAAVRVGQIVFDPNGEYANENVQDQDGEQNPNALKNVWVRHGEAARGEVITYGIKKRADDLSRRLMLLNFLVDANLQMGKEIVDSVLEADPSKYIRNFTQVRFVEPSEERGGARTRFDRRVLAYRALLVRAGFDAPADLRPRVAGLFSDKLLDAMDASAGQNAATHKNAAALLRAESPTWQQVAVAMDALYDFIGDSKSGYRKFNEDYVKTSSEGESWADEDLKKILEMFARPNGTRQLGVLVEQHTPETTTDYVDDIYAALAEGRLVIVDQSSGDPVLNASSSYRIVTKIFTENLKTFTAGTAPPHILVYAEEAHNLLPAGADLDLKNYWVRTAKEGGKCNIGLLYATQEVSSIQRNILKNTRNWFIGHLNNADETKELVKYDDFADFEQSIRRADDRGFIRMKTLSNRFVVPAQIHPFTVEGTAETSGSTSPPASTSNGSQKGLPLSE